MKYRLLSILALLVLGAGSVIQAQDYDDIYYDASKSSGTVKTKVETPAKTVVVYGEVPEKYKTVAKDNYREERDVDEYNRRGNFEPEYEVDINGDTIYEESFANTRRIERFYNPDVVILSDDDDLVELYYDESPTINLVVGSDWGMYSDYGWASSYYPWYTGWYEPWHMGWYSSPWRYGWYTGWYTSGIYRPYYWNWNYGPWYYSYWRNPYYWGYTGWYGWGHPHHYPSWGRPDRPHYSDLGRNSGSWRHGGGRAGLATNRNTRGRVGLGGTGSRQGITSRGASGNRSHGVGNVTTRTRSGYATTRSSGNMSTRSSSGVATRNTGVSRPSSSGSRSYSGSSSSRSSGSYSGGSRSSGGSYSGGGSRGSSGGGSHGGSSGGGGRRR